MTPRKRISAPIIAVLASFALVLGLGIVVIAPVISSPAGSEQAQAASLPYAAGWGPKRYIYPCISVTRHTGPDRVAFPNLGRGTFLEYRYNTAWASNCVVENYRQVRY